MVDINSLNIIEWINNLFGPYRDFLLAIIGLSLSFIYGNSFEYVFGIFSILMLALFFILSTQIFLYLSIGSLLLLAVVKIVHVYNFTAQQ